MTIIMSDLQERSKISIVGLENTQDVLHEKEMVDFQTNNNMYRYSATKFSSI